MYVSNGFRILAILVVAIAGTAPRSYASPITVPVGLAPGSQYRLVFVTAETTYQALDSNIADYNAEVSLEANSVTALLDLGTTWRVIGSTSSVNAITNIGSDPNVPIYNLDGLKVANDATTNSGGLFGSFGLFAPIGYNENGATEAGTFVFTGSNADGTTTVNGYLGNTASTTIFGGSGSVSGIWIDYSAAAPVNTHALYAISGELTVGGSSSTPEPTTTATMIMGVAFLYLAARRRHRIRRAN